MLNPEVQLRSNSTQFSTTDPDRAHEWIQSSFNEYETRRRGKISSFEFRANLTDLSDCTVSRLRFPMSSELAVSPMSVIVITQTFSGSYGFSDANRSIRATEGQILLFPYQQDMNVSWEQMDIGAVTLKPANVERLAEEVTGIAPADLHFDGGLPVSAAADRHWRGAVGYVNRVVLPNPAAASSALIRAEAGRLLAIALLTTFANTSMNFEAPARHYDMAPAALRRAVAYIEDNAHNEVTITDIALAAGVSARAIQHSFRRHLDMTPTAYARRVRLAGAHAELQTGDPSTGDTVNKIAARWGFGQAGRFATVYRQVYDHTPYQTLRS